MLLHEEIWVEGIENSELVNTHDHSYRQAANCACCGAFVKGDDSAKKKTQSTLALPLTKAPQQAYLWLGGEMVFINRTPPYFATNIPRNSPSVSLVRML